MGLRSCPKSSMVRTILSLFFLWHSSARCFQLQLFLIISLKPICWPCLSRKTILQMLMKMYLLLALLTHSNVHNSKLQSEFQSRLVFKPCVTISRTASHAAFETLLFLILLELSFAFKNFWYAASFPS